MPLTPAGKIDKKSLAAEVAFLENGAGIAC